MLRCLPGVSGATTLAVSAQRILAWGETVLCQERNRASFKAPALLPPHPGPAPSGRIVLAANAPPRGMAEAPRCKWLDRWRTNRALRRRMPREMRSERRISRKSSRNVFAIFPFVANETGEVHAKRTVPHWANTAAGEAPAKAPMPNHPCSAASASPIPEKPVIVTVAPRNFAVISKQVGPRGGLERAVSLSRQLKHHLSGTIYHAIKPAPPRPPPRSRKSR